MGNFTDRENVGSVFWTKSGSSVDDNATTAPDGTTTAERLNSTNTTTSFLSQSHTLDAAGQSTISVFAKEDDSGYGLCMTHFSYDPANSNTFFDLVTGQVGTVGPGPDSAEILDVGDGWYRCSVILTTTTSLTGSWRFYVADGDGDVNTPSGASIFVWGPFSNSGGTPAVYTSVNGILVPSASGNSPGVGLGFGKMGRMGA